MKLTEIKKPTRTCHPKRWLALAGLYEFLVTRMFGPGWPPGLQRNAETMFTKGAFWAGLGKLAKGEPRLYVVGWDMYETLCKMGIYQAVENEGWSIAVANERKDEDECPYTAKRIVGTLVCESPPTIIDVRSPGGQGVRFLDMRNWGLMPEMFDGDNDRPTLDNVQQGIEDYIAMCDLYGMGSLQTTAAAQGLYSFRKQHMEWHLLAHDDMKVRALERRAYYGGRAECFHLGQLPGWLTHLDVKSMYSALGEKLLLPTELMRDYHSPDDLCHDSAWAEHTHIADVRLNSFSGHFPCRIDGRLIWPVGTFDTTLAGEELRRAVNQGVVTQWHQIRSYKAAPIYAAQSKWYYDALNELELNGLDHLRTPLKLTVNASFGKIGARGKMWLDYPEEHYRPKWGQWWGRHPVEKCMTQFRAIDGAVQFLDGSGEPQNSLPAVAACMTAAGRMRLVDLIDLAGKANVYYCDTDGLIVSQDGLRRLMEQFEVAVNTPGKLQVRESGDDVEIFGIKNYRFGPRWCCASIPNDVVINGKDGTTWQAYVPFTHSLWQGRPFTDVLVDRSVVLSDLYQHGHLSRNGTIKPFNVRVEEKCEYGTDGRFHDRSVNTIVGRERSYAPQP
jgi:hypothetical protein